MRTLGNALLICVGLFILMAGVFTRPELVIEPGLAQIGALVMILAATIGITFSLQAQFADRRIIDVPVRLALAAIALVVLFHPDRQLAWAGCALVAAFAGYWWLRRREAPVFASPETP